jgi:molybdenum cofactor cytidylyltransferase
MDSSGHRIAGLVLAAGESKRMGPDVNKLLEVVAGQALVAWPVDALLGAGVDPVVVVTGHEAASVRRALADRPLDFVHHADWSEGMAGSIACGARWIVRSAPDCDAVFVALGDLPAIRSEHVRTILEAFESSGRNTICIPVYAGRRGHPVLFGAAHLPELASLHGEGGARGLFAHHRDSIIEVDVGSDAILVDVDTSESLRRARRRS